MNTFITIDFETAINARDSAISIGLVKYRDYRIVDTYYSLIRPPILYIREDFTDIHGLTIDDVKDAPDFKYLWENGICDFLKDKRIPLAAHNASFDMSVLKSVLQKYELSIPQFRYFCTCSLARRTWSGLESYSLTNLAEEFGIEYQAHNALEDAKACGKLVKMSAEKLQGSKSIKGLLRKAGLKMKVLE